MSLLLVSCSQTPILLCLSLSASCLSGAISLYRKWNAKVFCYKCVDWISIVQRSGMRSQMCVQLDTERVFVPVGSARTRQG